MSELAAAAAAGRVQGPHARAVAALAAPARPRRRAQRRAAAPARPAARRRAPSGAAWPIAQRPQPLAATSGAQACSFPTCLLWHEMSRPALLLVWSCRSPLQGKRDAHALRSAGCVSPATAGNSHCSMLCHDAN